MPEARVPQEEPSPYLEQLAQLSASSVPDLAATLITQAEQDAEDDNINFLRANLSDEDDNYAFDEASESRRRLRRAVDTMADSRVYTPAQLQELGEIQETYDASRRRQHQYQGWAPGTSDDEEDGSYRSSHGTGQSSAALLDEHVMRRDEHLRERMRLRRLRDATHAEWRDLLPPDSAPQISSSWDQPHSSERSSGSAPVSESSLRTTALLQAVRRNPQFSQRFDRGELQRYILDRERGDERDRTNSTRSSETTHQTLSSQRRQMHREATMRLDLQQQQDLLEEQEQQRDYLDSQLRHPQNMMSPPDENRMRRYQQTMRHAPSPRIDKRRIEDAIKYLEQLRLCESEEEGQEAAGEANFGPEFSRDHRAFLFNTRLIPSPPRSSFLRTGAVLSGIQHGASPASLPAYTPLPSTYRYRTRNPQFGSISQRNTSPLRRSPPANNADDTANHTPEEERWPVKVTINSVNYDEMTLTGTMEAFDVPDKSSPTKTSSITTYLEGEIIDFNAFTLETKSFRSDSGTDSTYWRKLPPFRSMIDDDAMVRKLLSKDWLQEELMRKWILMRWKEKCFVTPADAQTALTISGFYYVSLRRADGNVEGLYYDPQSNPYQHLSLKPEKPTMPAHAFQ